MGVGGPTSLPPINFLQHSISSRLYTSLKLPGWLVGGDSLTPPLPGPAAETRQRPVEGVINTTLMMSW